MADPFVAEIRIFPFTFAPRGRAFCNGQILPISQNTALFSLLGTFYGGNGQSTFALPNLQGSAPVAQGQGNGLSLYDLGQQGGSEFVTLLESEMPLHIHTMSGRNAISDSPIPTNNTLALYANAYQTNTTQNLVQMAFQSLPPAGGSLPHNNMMPYLTLNFNIAMQGVFPPRS
jgi:microcystin-dependent protein